MEKTKLKPSLWRTCRAIMNPARLNILRIAFKTNGELCVRDFAKALNLPDSIASIYLRQLNARGLLGVKRDRIKVFYNTDSNASLPDAIELQKAFRTYFKNDLPDGWECETMTTLRAFTHFNRLAILQRLAQGPATLQQLFDAMGVCVKSVYHHLGFLAAAHLIEEQRTYHQPSIFRLGKPGSPLAATLLRMTLADNGRYHNEGTGRGVDQASRHVYKRIRKAEGIGRSTWKETGPMKPRKGKIDKDHLAALKEDEE